MLTLLAIKDSLVGFFQMRIKSQITGKRLVIAVVAITVALSWVLVFRYVARVDRRETRREEMRQQERAKDAEGSKALEDRANQAEAKATELAGRNLILETEARALSEQIAAIERRYAKNRAIYATKRAEYEKIDDYNALRALNCERRKRLGYPCEY